MIKKTVRISEDLELIVSLFCLLVNESFNMFTKRSLIVRIDDLAPALLDRLKLLDFLLSQSYDSNQFYGKLLSLGLTPQSIRKLTRNYLSDKIKKKKLMKLIKALITKYGPIENGEFRISLV
jgi:hypothetical protein